MILTEQEAKQKLCHRTLANTGTYANAYGACGGYCRASKCMAWRWARGHSPKELAVRATYNPNPVEEPEGWCGLA